MDVSILIECHRGLIARTHANLGYTQLQLSTARVFMIENDVGIPGGRGRALFRESFLVSLVDEMTPIQATRTAHVGVLKPFVVLIAPLPR